MKKKKSTQTSLKTPKKHIKNNHQINNLAKILRPKVYITDSSNFKNLVQELTGNGKFSPISSPPTTDHIQEYHIYQDQNNLELSSFDSSCFSTPLEGSPDLHGQDSSFINQTMDYESLLMGIDHMSSFNYDHTCYGMFDQQEVCANYDYGYDFSSLIY
ncbi:hypothetical protein CDL12_01634 [Handroanthus impetiginosus]|uniref:VQ domain-containing protein n=1 Tax=Handroanthus impetiginosus TaxID=429701 RepID=A0A2G9I7A7_9LAMI|nr:hypothetical protein CDL12_01634 [Handroanthus impetiginosus]